MTKGKVAKKKIEKVKEEPSGPSQEAIDVAKAQRAQQDDATC